MNLAYKSLRSYRSVSVKWSDICETSIVEPLYVVIPNSIKMLYTLFRCDNVELEGELGRKRKRQREKDSSLAKIKRYLGICRYITNEKGCVIALTYVNNWIFSLLVRTLINFKFYYKLYFSEFFCFGIL